MIPFVEWQYRTPAPTAAITPGDVLISCSDLCLHWVYWKKQARVNLRLGAYGLAKSKIKSCFGIGEGRVSVGCDAKSPLYGRAWGIESTR